MPKIVAKNKTPTRQIMLYKIGDVFGRYSESVSISHTQSAKRISTTILKIKFLPVTNGKKRDLVTTSGKTGTMSNPILIILLIKFLFGIALHIAQKTRRDKSIQSVPSGPSPLIPNPS
ncbi:MAG: hypothetical protein AAB863_02050, partial [Patescibacteria group bacterium]